VAQGWVHSTAWPKARRGYLSHCGGHEGACRLHKVTAPLLSHSAGWQLEWAPSSASHVIIDCCGIRFLVISEAGERILHRNHRTHDIVVIRIKCRTLRNIVGRHRWVVGPAETAGAKAHAGLPVNLPAVELLLHLISHVAHHLRVVAGSHASEGVRGHLWETHGELGVIALERRVIRVPCGHLIVCELLLLLDSLVRLHALLHTLLVHLLLLLQQQVSLLRLLTRLYIFARFLASLLHVSLHIRILLGVLLLFHRRAPFLEAVRALLARALYEPQQVIVDLQGHAPLPSSIHFDGRGHLAAGEEALLKLEEVAVVALLVLGGQLLEGELLGLLELLPPVGHHLHDVLHCQEGATLLDDLPEVLREVDVSRQGLLGLRGV
jgi:hypothetical protein